MTELPSASIVVPTHGRPRQLARCLSAIAALDYPRERFEVVVVDDGGPEPLDPVVAPFREKIQVRLVRSEQLGPAAARNCGAELARGSLLAFTDDDCLPEPQWLRVLAAGLNGSDSAVGGKTLNARSGSLCSTASQAIVDWAYAFYNDGPEGPRFFASNNFAVSRARFLELGGFDPSFTVSEDRELCDRWRHHGLPLVYRREARVLHEIESSLAGFTRRHFRYGCGAYRFNTIRRSRRSGSLTRDLSFYRQLPRRAAALLREAGPRRGAGLGGLLVLWQLANVAGFCWEGARARLRRV
jgi:glycosyltransferase involved in cell wall biosynthesis